MRLIIAGGRNFNDFEMAHEFVLDLARNGHIPLDITILSGGARGADAIGEAIARQHNLPLEIYKADWEKYGRSAGYVRNTNMSDIADGVIAFWDGMSRGTKHMIETMQRKGKLVFICKY